MLDVILSAAKNLVIKTLRFTKGDEIRIIYSVEEL